MGSFTRLFLAGWALWINDRLVCAWIDALFYIESTIKPGHCDWCEIRPDEKNNGPKITSRRRQPWDHGTQSNGICLSIFVDVWFPELFQSVTRDYSVELCRTRRRQKMSWVIGAGVCRALFPSFGPSRCGRRVGRWIISGSRRTLFLSTMTATTTTNVHSTSLLSYSAVDKTWIAYHSKPSACSPCIQESFCNHMQL